MAAAMDTQEIKKEQEGYQTAFKATALFGGVQVINILVSILKSKIVALWLGTTGFGIMSLFNSATSLIYSITNLGRTVRFGTLLMRKDKTTFRQLHVP